MDNRVYYGEYSLKHWIDLILKKNIILPEYQRFFVWNETKTRVLIDTFKKNQFVPPITIGAFKDDETIKNLILDGQQRLTSILLAYIGVFPDEQTFKKAISKYADENDNPEDEDEQQFDNVFEWTFNELIKRGVTKETIRSKIIEGNYKNIDLDINEKFLKSTFLGFSYLVPEVSDDIVQQKYYSSVFRNINIQGEALLPQESRASLYYLDKDLANFFDPTFSKSLMIKNSGNESKIDFVRYLALLSQINKVTNTNTVARGYGRKMEKYYEEFIYSVVGENESTMFTSFLSIFPHKNYNSTFELINSTIDSLEIPKLYTSIIDLDIYLFGLLYIIIFEKKEIDISKNEDLKKKLTQRINSFKNNELHSRNPGALKYLRSRINESILIYSRYTNEQSY
jgi:uncharacterized protein with ParB-like and HNH nuclease domain